MEINCVICNEKEKDTVKDPEMGLYYCEICSHIFKKTPNDEQEKYEADCYSDENKNWFLHPNIGLFIMIENAIKKRFQEKAVSILNMGCGKGDFPRFMKNKNPLYKLKGIDLILKLKNHNYPIRAVD